MSRITMRGSAKGLASRAVGGALLLAAVAFAPAASAQLLPLGGEFQVNAYTPNSQYRPFVAPTGSSGFVVMWFSDGSGGSDTSDQSIQAQRYDQFGSAIGPQFQVNTYTYGYQYGGGVAGTDANGGFVIVWESEGSLGSDVHAASIQARRYDGAGIPLGTEFQVNTYTTNGQFDAAVANDGADGFVVAWDSNGSAGSDTSSLSIQARRYDATGAPLGAQFQVNTYTTGTQGSPALVSTGAGTFVVTWTSDGSAGYDTSGRSVQGQRYDAAGTPVGGEFQVNTYTTGYQGFAAVSGDGAGGFVVAWSSIGSAGSDTSSGSIHAQRFDAAGLPSGVELEVNTYTTANQSEPAVSSDGVGFVVTWSSDGGAGPDTSLRSIHGQRFAATGAPIDAEFEVNTYTTGGQRESAVSGDGAGGIVVAWQGDGSGSDTDSGAILAQRYAVGRSILGKKLLVKDPTGAEGQRTIIAMGKESATDIGATVLGDPIVNGATLRVITNGMTFADQTYLLDASGWSAAGTVGFKYTGPTGGDGDPVRKVLIKRTPGGTALLKVILKGNVGTQSLDVVPPNLGDDGGIILAISGGGTYCASLGGAAGGSEIKDTGQLWKIVNAGAQPGCPSRTPPPSCPTFGGSCGACGDGICGGHPDPAPPLQVCVSQGSLTASACTEDADCGPGLVCTGPGPFCGLPCP